MPKPRENPLMSLKTILATFTIPSLLVCTLGLSGPASAQNPPTSQKQLDIAAARAQRKATVGANMNLTDADAKKKLDEVIAIQQARLDVQKEFIAQFRAVVSQVKVTRFYQIDNKIQALIQCDLAQLVPLAQSPGEVAQ